MVVGSREVAAFLWIRAMVPVRGLEGLLQGIGKYALMRRLAGAGWHKRRLLGSRQLHLICL